MYQSQKFYLKQGQVFRKIFRNLLIHIDIHSEFSDTYISIQTNYTENMTNLYISTPYIGQNQTFRAKLQIFNTNVVMEC